MLLLLFNLLSLLPMTDLIAAARVIRLIGFNNTKFAPNIIIGEKLGSERCVRVSRVCDRGIQEGSTY